LALRTTEVGEEAAHSQYFKTFQISVMVEMGVCDQKRGLDCFSKLSVGIQLEIFKKQSFYCQLPIDTFFVLGCSIFQKFDTKENIRKTVSLRLGPIFSCASSWGWKTRTDFESTLPKLSDNIYICAGIPKLSRDQKNQDLKWNCLRIFCNQDSFEFQTRSS